MTDDALRSLTERLQRLEDLQEIRALYVDYGRHLDAGDFAAQGDRHLGLAVFARNLINAADLVAGVALLVDEDCLARLCITLRQSESFTRFGRGGTSSRH